MTATATIGAVVESSPPAPPFGYQLVGHLPVCAEEEECHLRHRGSGGVTGGTGLAVLAKTSSERLREQSRTTAVRTLVPVVGDDPVGQCVALSARKPDEL